MAQSQMPSSVSSEVTILDSKPDPERLKQAAYWFATLTDNDASEADESGWRDWCQQCPENAQAWHYIERVSQRFHAFEQPEQQETAYSALNSAQQVVVSRRDSLRLFSGLLLASVGSWLGWRYSPVGNKLQAMLADHQTRIGEVRPLRLADQSQLWLNTDSAINVAFSEQQRLLNLVRGEVLIETTRESRPFIVQTEQGALRASEARFSVQQLTDRCRLSVFNGSVEITCQQSSQRSVISSGHQAVFDAVALRQKSPARQTNQSWSQGLLQADSITLRDFIQQVDRYHPHFIQVSEQVAHIPVVGTFPAHDLDKILLMLQESLQIKAQQVLPWWVRIEPA